MPRLFSGRGFSSLQQVDGALFHVRGEVRVSERHRQVGVPEQLPDGVQIDAGHHEPGREVVAHVVPAEVIYLRMLQDRLPCCAVVGDRLPGAGVGEDVLSKTRKGGEGLADDPVHRELLLLLRLRRLRPERDRAGGEVDIGPSQIEQRPLPDAGVQGDDDGSPVQGVGFFEYSHQAGALLRGEEAYSVGGIRLAEAFEEVDGVPRYQSAALPPVQNGPQSGDAAVDRRGLYPLLLLSKTPFFHLAERDVFDIILPYKSKEVSKRLKRERRALPMRRHPWGVFLFHEVPQGEDVVLPRFLSFGDHRQVFPGKLAGFGDFQDVGVSEFFRIAPTVRSCIIDVPRLLSGGLDPQKELVENGVPDVVPFSLRLRFRYKGVGEFFGHGVTSRTRYVLRFYYTMVSSGIQESVSKKRIS